MSCTAIIVAIVIERASLSWRASACFLCDCWQRSASWFGSASGARVRPMPLPIRRPKVRRVAVLQAQSHAPKDWLALSWSTSHGPSPPPGRVGSVRKQSKLESAKVMAVVSHQSNTSTIRISAMTSRKVQPLRHAPSAAANPPAGSVIFVLSPARLIVSAPYREPPSAVPIRHYPSRHRDQL
ncbi:hypothetical protein BKA63DRAFT_484967 [Paraphoma chrysanthemicola]|nr:hypothetical protein BKA63DRAFT_484967 [Paraphoma chrysanthemicola]